MYTAYWLTLIVLPCVRGEIPKQPKTRFHKWLFSYFQLRSTFWVSQIHYSFSF